MQTPQPWTRGGIEVKTDLNEIGEMMIGMKVAGLKGATTARDMVRGIQVIVTDGRTTGMTEASIDGTVGQGLGPQGGDRDPGTGTTRDGDALRKE